MRPSSDPRDGGTLVEQERRVEVGDVLLHDHAHTQNLTFVVIRNELRREHLDDDVGVLLLRVDEGVEIRLARLDGRLDGLERVTTLGHVALNLPRKLNLVGDVQVNLEIKHVAHALVGERVKTFEDEHLRGFNLLRRVEHARDVVVDRLIDSLTLLERLDLFVHQIYARIQNTDERRPSVSLARALARSRARPPSPVSIASRRVGSLARNPTHQSFVP